MKQNVPYNSQPNKNEKTNHELIQAFTRNLFLNLLVNTLKKKWPMMSGINGKTFICSLAMACLVHEQYPISSSNNITKSASLIIA